jgi:hypothetical protein
MFVVLAGAVATPRSGVGREHGQGAGRTVGKEADSRSRFRRLMLDVGEVNGPGDTVTFCGSARS